MVSLLADQNFDGSTVRRVQRRARGVDSVRAQSVDLTGPGDPIVLVRAANQGRVLITHDVT